MKVHTGVRTKHRLSPRKVATVRARGSYADGGGLYLRVSESGNKSWVFRFGLNKTTHEMGLGPFARVSLSQARALSETTRDYVKQGINPIEARRAKAPTVETQTFAQCAETYIERTKVEWRNVKHHSQWRNTLATYAYPVIGDIAVGDITTDHVLNILEPIWTTRTETATRVRGRIESVLDWASAKKYRTGDNPARWQGNLKQLLPDPSKVKKAKNDGELKHHGAVEYGEVASFLRDVRKMSGIAPAALEFVILTAARTGEALKAQWSEFNLDGKEATWTIPGKRMKANREHRVPLSARAVEILQSMMPLRDEGDHVFPSPMKPGQPLSDMTLLMIVRRLKGKDVTTHGFRSSFRDWAAEETPFPNIVAEAALAHVVGDKTEAAYRRGDLFEKRRKMMNAWAKYCETVAVKRGNVVPMRASR